MRLWPFQSTEPEVGGAPPEGFHVIEDVLRRNLEDIFRVLRQDVRGASFGWGGELRVEPARALALLEPRFKPFGYTPFIGRQGDMVWIRAIPLAEVAETRRSRLNLLLFGLTLLSTLAAGSIVAGSFPFVTFNPLLQPGHLADGVPFAFTLLAILGTHEFGHYFAARYHGASVSLPYFIPAPPPIFLFGTLGAVIRMRSPARDRNSLFDIAVAGPLAGLVVALPLLLLGLSWSRVGMVLPEHAGLTFGDSLLMRFLTWLVFGPIPQGMDVFVHPVALAGWVGLFVTALNLFPVGQLDGGRIAYALFGPFHRQISIATFVGLIALGALFRSANWIVFGTLILLLMGFHHAPPLDDLTPLTPRRYALGVACLILLVLLIPPVPIS
ncbi:MAG TPA: site-2 protease family protein [Candidatus Bathyarchaeia archaeon]|nr:site-2 protease family protein [Candidatus Bathyarchaeia archaeon]